MEPFARDRVYVNFLGYEGADRIRAGYGEEKYERLAALKATWDPTNFLRHNQNIEPLGSGSGKDPSFTELTKLDDPVSGREAVGQG